MEGYGHTDGRWRSGSDPWTVRAYWGVVDGRVECIGVGLWKGCEPNPDGHYELLPGGASPIRATDLRNVPIAGLVTKLRKAAMARDESFRTQVAQLVANASPETSDDVLNALRSLGAIPARSVKTAGRYVEAHWSAVAAVYSQAWQKGENPTRAVQEHFSTGKLMPYSTASKWVARARDEGMLPRLGQGVAGGPTAKRSRKTKGKASK
jgi:hypothetical protein